MIANRGEDAGSPPGPAPCSSKLLLGQRLIPGRDGGWQGVGWIQWIPLSIPPRWGWDIPGQARPGFWGGGVAPLCPGLVSPCPSRHSWPSAWGTPASTRSWRPRCPRRTALNPRPAAICEFLNAWGGGTERAGEGGSVSPSSPPPGLGAHRCHRLDVGTCTSRRASPQKNPTVGGGLCARCGGAR